MYGYFKKWVLNHLWNLQGSFSLKGLLFKHLLWVLCAPLLSQRRKSHHYFFNISLSETSAGNVVNCSLSVGWQSPDGDVYDKLNALFRKHPRQSLLQTILFFNTHSTIKDRFAPIKISSTHKPVRTQLQQTSVE